jgi:hypothetical protein
MVRGFSTTFGQLAENATAQHAAAEDTTATKDATSTEHTATAAPLDTTPTPLDTELVHFALQETLFVVFARLA